eukprot:1804183-Pleurochrysis_carterae.AAC.5
MLEMHLALSALFARRCGCVCTSIKRVRKFSRHAQKAPTCVFASAVYASVGAACVCWPGAQCGELRRGGDARPHDLVFNQGKRHVQGRLVAARQGGKPERARRADRCCARGCAAAAGGRLCGRRQRSEALDADTAHVV